jgi:hypothetical protein
LADSRPLDIGGLAPEKSLLVLPLDLFRLSLAVKSGSDQVISLGHDLQFLGQLLVLVFEHIQVPGMLNYYFFTHDKVLVLFLELGGDRDLSLFVVLDYLEELVTLLDELLDFGISLLTVLKFSRGIDFLF